MKTISPALAQLLLGRQFFAADLLTLYPNGVDSPAAVPLRLTSADRSLNWGGNVFQGGRVLDPTSGVTRRVPLFERGGTKVTRTVEVATLDLTFFADLNCQVYNAPFVPLALAGGFDGGRVLLQRAYAPDPGAALLGAVHLFGGRVSAIEGDREQLHVTVSSDLELLDVQIPRNIYQPGCLATLYDTACGLDRAAWSDGLVAQAGSTALRVLAAHGRPDGYYSQGTLVMGGIARTVRRQVGNVFELLLPLPAAPAAGAALVARPGCDKAMATCSAKFANLGRFRGAPFIPRQQTAGDAPVVSTTTTPGGGGGGGGNRPLVNLN